MDKPYTLHLGNCLDVLKAMPTESVDSVVCDPPYGLSFMGKRWDYDVPSVDVWAECLRVLKPGGHLLAFAGTRTQHRMAVRIEDAGFEIRDMIAWVYGSGFPKSLDVSKAIDKARRRDYVQVALDMGLNLPGRNVDDWTKEGHAPGDKWWSEFKAALPPETWQAIERRVIGSAVSGQSAWFARGVGDVTAPATDAARQWQGWGTALKPALETVTFASKPYTDKQVRGIIQSNLFRLEARLWLLSSANAAGKSSTSNQSEYGAACAIAQWNADEITSTRADLCGQMDTSLFALATTTSLNIVSSWRRTLDESLSDGSTSTIETKSSTTIDWRTLKFSVSQITPASIIKACSLPGGFSANASTAESHFNASLLLLQSILTLSVTEPVISLAQHEHQGAGVTPNLDPVVLARKPLVGTVAANVLAHGTGGLNIDGCRVEGTPAPTRFDPAKHGHEGWRMNATGAECAANASPLGRWPANLIHDGSDEVVAAFPDSNGSGPARKLNRSAKPEQQGWGMNTTASDVASLRDAGTGSAARFFYAAKASKRDRDEGLEHMDAVHRPNGNKWTDQDYRVARGERPASAESGPRKNIHPTIKPTDLMAYLCRLVTPPGGVVLDPFMGSGSTGKAAMREGFRFIGCELSEEYLAIARARIEQEVRTLDLAAAKAQVCANDAQADLFVEVEHA